MTTPLTPPRAAERLLALAFSDSDLRDAVLGDLHEEYVARAARAAGLRLRVWYCIEALRLAVRFTLRRLGRYARRSRAAAPSTDDIRQETLMSGLRSDLKLAFRTLRQQPGVSLVTAVTLALGLGINATVLGMMDAMLFRPFQFQDADRLVVLWETVRGGSERETVSQANFLDWRAQARSLEQIEAWAWLDATLTGRGEPERVQGFRVTSGFFDLLGIVPALGRTFVPDDERLGRHRHVVVSDGLWKRRFGGDRHVVGTDIEVDGVAHTVVGVAPPGFSFPVGCELWVPLALTPAQATDRESRPLTVAGRLAGAQSLPSAQAELDTISRRLAQEHPRTNGDRGVSVRSLATAFREGSTVPFVAILQAAAALVLLVACANVAGLLLARAMDRQRELAIKTALGASRARIVRQFVVETVLLGLLAAAVAVPLASIGLDALRVSIPPETARFVEGWDNLRLDGRVAAAIPLLAIVVGLLIGLVPALAATRPGFNDALKDGDRAMGGIRRQRGRQVLVVVEIALALALLVAAGLTVAGGRRLTADPGGFDAEGLLTFQVPLPEPKYAEPGPRREFVAALIARMQASPMVRQAAIANVLPASGWSPSMSFVVDHDPAPDLARRPRSGFRTVSTDFFEALRVPVVAGRTFTTADREGTQPVAIVSASLAERFWPGQDPIGKRLRLDDTREEWRHIVGIVGDVRMFNWWDGEDALAVYVPLRQAPPGGLVYAVVRTHGNPAATTASIREAIRSVDPLLPVTHARTLREAVAESGAGLGHLALLMAVCGGIGLLLSLLGIYSVMAYAVSQRIHEFGVRMALGATGREVLRLTVTEALALTGCGLALGLLLAVVLGRLLSSALFGLITLQPTIILGVGLGLAAVSLAAACVPARRAVSLDPAIVLRGR